MLPPRDLLDTYVGRIEDPQLLSLISDLEATCRVSAADFEKGSFFLFLVQCVYPNGSRRERQSVNPSLLPHESLLEATLDSLGDSPVFTLCECLLRRKRTSTEFYSDQTVADVINDSIPQYGDRRTDAEVIDDVVLQRRLNRRP